MIEKAKQIVTTNLETLKSYIKSPMPCLFVELIEQLRQQFDRLQSLHIIHELKSYQSIWRISLPNKHSHSLSATEKISPVSPQM